jgi:hypothetical protein
MRVSATADAVRLLSAAGRWARRADARLARTAEQNAQHSVNAARARELDDARTLRDLERIPAADVRDVVTESRASAAH